MVESVDRINESAKDARIVSAVLGSGLNSPSSSLKPGRSRIASSTQWQSSSFLKKARICSHAIELLRSKRLGAGRQTLDRPGDLGESQLIAALEFCKLVYSCRRLGEQFSLVVCGRATALTASRCGRVCPSASKAAFFRMASSVTSLRFNDLSPRGCLLFSQDSLMQRQQIPQSSHFAAL